nr:MAG TPA: hypothetical protein [Caudoviricetes sp.]
MQTKFFLIVFIATIVGQIAYIMFRRISNIVKYGYTVTEKLNSNISIPNFIKMINTDHDKNMSRKEYEIYIDNQLPGIYKEFLLNYDETLRAMDKDNVRAYKKVAIDIVVKIGFGNLYRVYFEGNNILYSKY